MSTHTRRVVLAAIIVLATALYTVNIRQDGLGNHYYTAAARNMTSSLSNFFFGSFDSRGFVSVDKPPVGLWVQALVIRAFGLNTFSVMLPSILAGIASVCLMYLLVRQTFGDIAGLSAAFLLAITPVSVALARNNTMDAMLIAVLLGATWLFMKGIGSGRLRDVLLSAIVVGVAFNIKMAQAYVVLPAFFLVFLVYHRPPLATKIGHAVLVTAVLVAVSFSWAVAVDMTPDDQRPYVGGSSTNSAVDLMVHYNGLDRAREDAAPGRHNLYFETGRPGFFRLFNPLIGGQIGWLLPFAVLGTLLYVVSAAGVAKSAERRDLLFWATWCVTLYLYLSFNTGYFHTHYIAMASPAVAALGGIGVAASVGALRGNTVLKWFPPAILLLTMVSQWRLAQPFAEWNRPMTTAMVVVSVVAAGTILLALITRRAGRLVVPAYAAGLLALSILPFSWALTPLLYGGDPGIPYARPDLREMKMAEEYFRVTYRDPAEYQPLLAFLNTSRDGEEFLLGVESALAEGSNLMLLTDGDIMAVGGFAGIDPILNYNDIEALVENGTIRFFLLTAESAYIAPVTAWVVQHGDIVLNREWKRPGELLGLTLYDCRPGTADR